MHPTAIQPARSPSLLGRAGRLVLGLFRAVGDFIVIVAYTPFAEMLIWIGTLFGGIIFASAQDLGTRIVGVVVVTVAVSPLAVRGTRDWSARRRDEFLDGREATAAQFGVAVLEEAADFESSDRADRVTMAEEGVNEALDHIWRSYFSSNDRVRVLFYEINDAKTRLVTDPKYPPRGRNLAEARPFASGEGARGDLALARFDSPLPFHYTADTSLMSDEEFGDAERPYETFIALPIRSTSDAFGMLTVDSTRRADLTERDGPALETYANAIAFYLAAQRRGRQNRKQNGGSSS